MPPAAPGDAPNLGKNVQNMEKVLEFNRENEVIFYGASGGDLGRLFVMVMVMVTVTVMVTVVRWCEITHHNITI